MVHAPLIATRPRTDEEARAAGGALLALPWLLFTSRSAVEAWSGLGIGWRAPTEAAGRRAARGRGGAQDGVGAARRRRGAALVAERSSRAAGLVDAFLEHPDAASPVGLPQGDRALPTLRCALERAGFETRPLVLYETVTQPWSGDATVDGAADGAAAGDDAASGAELVVLASPSAAEALPDEVARRAALVAIGPTTAAALERRGLAPRQARAPSVGGVLEAVDAAEAEGGATPSPTGTPTGPPTGEKEAGHESNPSTTRERA